MTLILGILTIVISARQISTDEVLNDIEPAFAGLVTGIGVSIALVGLLGVIGSIVASRTALCVYGVLALVVATVTVVAGGTFLATVNGHGEEINHACMLDRKTGQLWSKFANKFQNSYDSMKQALQNCRRNGRMEALRLQDCGQLGKADDGSWWNDDKYMPLFYYIEARSGCGGMCTGDIPLFGFPENLVTGKPVVDQTNKELLRHPCFHELANLLEGNGDKVSASIIAFGLPILFSVCGACWIVCYPPPLARKGYVHSPYRMEPNARGFAS